MQNKDKDKDKEKEKEEGSVVPLSSWGQYIGMTELSGPLLKNSIPRNKKVRFVCHGCGQLAEDYAVGYICSSVINPKTKKRMFLVQGQFTATCAYRWVQEQRYTFSEHVQELYTLMLMEAYGVSPEALKTCTLPPALWEMPQYRSETQNKIPRQSGLEFHATYALKGMRSPDPELCQIVEARSTLMIEAFSLRTLSISHSELKRLFPTLYIKQNSSPTDVIPNTNIKRFSMFSAMNAQQEQQHKQQQELQHTKQQQAIKYVLDPFLKPIPKR